MKKRMLARFLVLLLSLFAAYAQEKLPDGPGKAVMNKVCVACHAPEVVAEHRFTQEEWVDKLGEMVEHGAKATEDELNQILAYLVANFLQDGKTNVNKASAHELETALEITGKDAAAIVRHREQKGGYKSFEDLKKVPNLDLKKLEAKKDRLTF